MRSSREPPRGVAGAHELHILFREVQRRLGERPQFDQRVDRGANLRRERSREAARRSARSRGGRGIDQIRDRLCLGEVELPVEKRAAREFSRLRDARPEIEAAAEHEREHGSAAMSVQLQNALSGIRRGGGEVERDALVERFAVGAAERGQRCSARSRHLAQDAGDDPREVAAGDAHDADSAAAGRRGDRRDRFSGRAHRRRRARC